MELHNTIPGEIKDLPRRIYLRWDENVGDASHKDVMEHLGNMRETILEALAADKSALAEMRFLLTDAISRVSLESAHQNWLCVKHILFANRTKVAHHLQEFLLFCFETLPDQVGRFLSNHPEAVTDFFNDHPNRIQEWFSHFSPEGLNHFRWGAKPLATFSLSQRDQAWEFLVWGGNHPQAPVAVATKIHYFCELKVQETIENLLEHCPDFWSSRDFRKSLLSGEILSLDPEYFSQAISRRFLSSSSSLHKDLEDLLQDVLRSVGSCQWLHRFASDMSDDDIFQFLKYLRSSQFQSERENAVGLESQILFARWSSFLEVLLAYVIHFHRQAVLSFVESNPSLGQSVVAAALKLHCDQKLHKGQCALKNAINRLDLRQALMVQGLELVSLRIAMLHVFNLGGSDAVAKALRENNYTFRSQSHVDKYAMLASSDEDKERKVGRKKKKGKKRQKLLHHDSRRDETADTIWELQFSSQDDFVTCQGVMQVVVALLNEAKESWCQGPCPSD